MPWPIAFQNEVRDNAGNIIVHSTTGITAEFLNEVQARIDAIPTSLAGLTDVDLAGAQPNDLIVKGPGLGGNWRLKKPLVLDSFMDNYSIPQDGTNAAAVHAGFQALFDEANANHGNVLIKETPGGLGYLVNNTISSFTLPASGIVKWAGRGAMFNLDVSNFKFGNTSRLFQPRDTSAGGTNGLWIMGMAANGNSTLINIPDGTIAAGYTGIVNGGPSTVTVTLNETNAVQTMYDFIVPAPVAAVDVQVSTVGGSIREKTEGVLVPGTNQIVLNNTRNSFPSGSIIELKKSLVTDSGLFKVTCDNGNWNSAVHFLQPYVRDWPGLFLQLNNARYCSVIDPDVIGLWRGGIVHLNGAHHCKCQGGWLLEVEDDVWANNGGLTLVPHDNSIKDTVLHQFNDPQQGGNTCIAVRGAYNITAEPAATLGGEYNAVWIGDGGPAGQSPHDIYVRIPLLDAINDGYDTEAVRIDSAADVSNVTVELPRVVGAKKNLLYMNVAGNVYNFNFSAKATNIGKTNVTDQKTDPGYNPAIYINLGNFKGKSVIDATIDDCGAEVFDVGNVGVALDDLELRLRVSRPNQSTGINTKDAIKIDVGLRPKLWLNYEDAGAKCNHAVRVNAGVTGAYLMETAIPAGHTVGNAIQDNGIGTIWPARDAETWRLDVDPFTVAVLQTGTWADVVNVGQMKNGYKTNTSSAQNDEIGWDLPLSAGTWSLFLVSANDPAGAIATVMLDGVSTGKTIDMYQAVNSLNKTPSVTGIVVPTGSGTGIGGKHRVSLKAATRNASNTTGWKLFISSLTMRRTA
jgi:hypothetical protein